MKKLFLFIIIILLVGCVYLLVNKPKVKKEVQNTNNIPEVVGDIPIQEEEPTYVDNNPIKVSLYKNYRNNTNRKKITEYTSNFEYHKDISSFEVYYTDEEEIPSTNQIKLFDKYLNEYTDIDNYRIGYIISFNTDNETNKTILSPKDVEEFYDYLEVYLYDDYHRHGEWYSHTTENEFNDNTLLTSIKLTSGKKVNEITSDITLTVFTYVKDDLDESNNYKGNSKYTIIIKKA